MFAPYKGMELIAKQTADFFFPGEIWIKWEERIYVSSRRKIGGKSNFLEELRDAQILRDAGYTVYLVPEDIRSGKKQYDAIVDGMQMEFKNIKGKSRNTFIEHFFRSRKQAPNVFFNLEKSSLSKHKVISALIGARNSKKYEQINSFPEGGIVIMKIKEQLDLNYFMI